MLITFEMISENLNINYKVFGKREGNVISFPDKSIPNTMMFITLSDNQIEVVRSGSVSMKQVFKPLTKQIGYYKNDLGIEFKIASFTKELVVDKNSVTVLYEHYLDDKWQSSNKLKILF